MLKDTLILQNLQPLESLPFEFGKLNDIFGGRHEGTMIDIDPKLLELKIQEAMLRQKDEEMHKQLDDLQNRIDAMEDPGKVLLVAATERDRGVAIKAEELLQATAMAKRVRAASLEDYNRKIKFSLVDDEFGWFPDEVGDSITWTARADNYDPNLTLHWSFLLGNVQALGAYIPAIYDCSDQPYQHLTWNNDTYTLGLTNSEVTVNLSNLINDDMNELQDLYYDNVTKRLYITNSTDYIDLSHLDAPAQQLEWSDKSMELRLSGTKKTINLGKILGSQATDLAFDNDTHMLELEGTGKTADLSPLRIITLQAAIENVNGKKNENRRLVKDDYYQLDDEEVEQVDLSAARRKRSVRGTEGNLQEPKSVQQGRPRRLSKLKTSVRYGGEAKGGWTMIHDGRLVGMSIAADFDVTRGIFRVEVAECSDLDNMKRLAEMEFLELRVNSGRSDSLKFVTPIRVSAGDIICFFVTRPGGEDVKSSDNNNPATVVLMLEQ